MCSTRRATILRFVCALITCSVLACNHATDTEQDKEQDSRWPALTTAANEAGRDLELFDFPPQQKPSDTSGMSAVLQDIMSHLPPDVSGRRSSVDMTTWAYESTHGVQDVIRERFNRTGRNVAGIYLLGDKAAVVIEPKIQKKRMSEFLPPVLRGENHDLYLLGQVVQDERPLQLLEELVARVNTAAVALEERLANKQATASFTSGFSGLLEFSAYNIALAMAVQKYDASYFVEHKQFTAILGITVERALLLHRLNKAMNPESTQEDHLYQHLMRGPEGNSMRAFVARLYGAPWFNRSFINQEAPQLAVNKTILTVLTDTLPHSASDEDKDGDGDGVPDRLDQCPETKKSPVGSTKVWTYGDWMGCAEGELRH